MTPRPPAHPPDHRKGHPEDHCVTPMVASILTETCLPTPCWTASPNNAGRRHWLSCHCTAA
eukprot:11791976-Prorocentrum_lima.AAC.1